MSAERTIASQTLEAYERWAPTYVPDAHNPLMHAEQSAMLAALPRVGGLRTLDLACGTGRYARLLRERNAASVVAVDLSSAMLSRAIDTPRVQADMRRLPFARAAFDLAVAGLAVGHIANLTKWVEQVAWSLADGGTLLYSDFHPEAARAGLTRSFKDENNRSWTLPHHRHEIGDHLAALAGAHYTIDLVKELRVGQEVSEPFAGSELFYREWDGLPLVLIIRVHR